MNIKENENNIKNMVTTHIKDLKDQVFKISVQVLKEGDSYGLKTGDCDQSITVDSSGYLPSKKNFTDAGFDLFTPYDVVIKPGEIVKVPLNIRMKLPTGSWARIETKSGLGSKGMLVYAGVVDQDYRGVPHVIATNLKTSDKEPIVIKAGEKIAQMTINPHSLEYFVQQVEKIETNTSRGEGGFGSTGRT